MIAVSPVCAAPAPKATSAAPIASAQKTHHSNVAPADEYFGRLKLSILGIRNTIRDMDTLVAWGPDKLPSILSKCAFAEDALHDWQHKYPRDSWVPRTGYLLAQLYGKIASSDASTDAHDRAIATMQWVVSLYPQTWYGRDGRKRLADGTLGVIHVAASAAPPPEVAASPLLASPLPAPTGSASSETASGSQQTKR